MCLLEPANITGCQLSKMKDCNGEQAILVVQRKRVLANGGLPEVHWGASQQAVVDFMFAAIPVIRVEIVSGKSEPVAPAGQRQLKRSSFRCALYPEKACQAVFTQVSIAA